MPLVNLEITGFRNLHDLKLNCAAGLNLIRGDNAAGKTSFLEAIYFLSRGRSFRTPRTRDMIGYSQRSLQIVARVQGEAGSRPVTAGMSYNGIRLNARLDATPIRSLAELSAQIPVLLLTPDSHRLLDAGPQQRRRFVDWGLFHSDSGFITVWRRYQTALRQRNAALRAGQPSAVLAAWENELVTMAEQLDERRQGFCQALAVALAPLLKTLLGAETVSIDYQRGWPQDQSLAVILRDDVMADRRQGHTRRGAHRADFTVHLEGKPAALSVSRGQQKLLIIALILAQTQLYQQRRHHPCILLIDDLPAELDSDNRQRVLSCLANQSIQLFITAIEEHILDYSAWSSARRFEITHGHIAEVV